MDNSKKLNVSGKETKDSKEQEPSQTYKQIPESDMEGM